MSALDSAQLDSINEPQPSMLRLVEPVHGLKMRKPICASKYDRMGVSGTIGL